MSDRRLVLVVGVGRSGTSLVSGILGQLGFHIPQPEVKADETNPRGFGEPRWVVDFHDRLLKDRRVAVNDARPGAWPLLAAVTEDGPVRAELGEWLGEHLERGGPLLVKDPRTVWFLPLWRACADELGLATSFLTMLRHPAEIVASARRSYGPGLTAAGRAAAWVNVILQTEEATRGAARAFVRYEDLLADWAAEIRRVGPLIQAPALASVDRAAHPAVEAFVDPSLRRHRVTWNDLDVPAGVRDLAEHVWDRLQVLAGPDGGDPARADLDAARTAYSALYREAESIAQSSALAARRRRPQTPAAAPAVGSAPLRIRVARRIPVAYRRHLRRALRSLRGS